jgi:CheY-like chemotaxis protein
MPLMNGMDIYKEIRKDPALLKIPVVVFTTSCNSKEVEYWQKQNVTIITKPASFNDFKERIKTILGYCSVQ